MPAQPSWLVQLPRIRHEVRALNAPVVDRETFEQLFGVRRRRAIQLMHAFGGYQAGRTFLVETASLLRDLERLERGDEFQWERTRRARVAEELEQLRKSLPGRQIKITMPREAWDHRLADLSAGIHLKAGELRIEFNGTEDLLRQLVELSQAIIEDYRRFEEICEENPPGEEISK